VTKVRLQHGASAARVLAFGGYQPSNVVTNDDLAATVDTTDEWIRSRVGIASRRLAGQDETVADMAVIAAGKALAGSGLSPADIDLVIVATCTPEVMIPNTAAIVARRLGIAAPGAYDLNAACAGFCYALAAASDAVRAGSARHVLVIGAEIMSRVIGLSPVYRDTAILFGDGAGACVVSADAGFAEIRDSLLCSDGDYAGILRLDVDAPLHMDGRSVIMQVSRRLPRAIQQLLDRNARKAVEIDTFLLHQANGNLITKVASTLGAEDSRFFRNLEIYGNTSSASMLIAAAEWYRANGSRIKGPIVMAAFGAGLNWGALLADPV